MDEAQLEYEWLSHQGVLRTLDLISPECYLYVLSGSLLGSKLTKFLFFDSTVFFSLYFLSFSPHVLQGVTSSFFQEAHPAWSQSAQASLTRASFLQVALG